MSQLRREANKAYIVLQILLFSLDGSRTFRPNFMIEDIDHLDLNNLVLNIYLYKQIKFSETI